jgi:hypothetical protein
LLVESCKSPSSSFTVLHRVSCISRACLRERRLEQDRRGIQMGSVYAPRGRICSSFMLGISEQLSPSDGSGQCNKVQHRNCVNVRFYDMNAFSAKVHFRPIFMRVACMFTSSSRNASYGFVNRRSSVQSRPLAPPNREFFLQTGASNISAAQNELEPL